MRTFEPAKRSTPLPACVAHDTRPFTWFGGGEPGVCWIARPAIWFMLATTVPAPLVPGAPVICTEPPPVTRMPWPVLLLNDVCAWPDGTLMIAWPVPATRRPGAGALVLPEPDS